MYELKLNQELSDVFSVSPLYDLHINDIINQYLQVRQCIICSNTGEIINRCNACDTCFVCDECFDRYVFEYSSCGSCGSILDTEILLLCREIRYYLKGPFQSTASNDSRVINLTNRCTDLLNANRPNPINKQIINCYQSAINRENRSRTVNLRCVRGALLSSICVLSLTLSLLFIGIPGYIVSVPCIWSIGRDLFRLTADTRDLPGYFLGHAIKMDVGVCIFTTFSIALAGSIMADIRYKTLGYSMCYLLCQAIANIFLDKLRLVFFQ